ncbi:hypothetical protein R9C00_10665 [Flammeovirgaceae bacterium SG7u.111]|nr:hypothetical protein [Flammeovirgaceae bacterium SG7u.132]WPO37914.1 hypothetical protein R9C00_10665 [Flammeovirgaceae bacterium SG7u.111]
MPTNVINNMSDNQQITELLSEIDRVLFGKNTLKFSPQLVSSSKRAMATSYAELLMSDPSNVTKFHVRILLPEFSKQEIALITSHVFKAIDKNKHLKKILTYLEN